MSKVSGYVNRLQCAGQEQLELFDHLNEAILLIDARTGCFVYANSGAEHLLGKSCDEIIGSHLKEIYSPEKAEDYQAEFYKPRQTRGFLYAEVVRADGNIVPVAITSSEINIDGQTLRAGIFRDITDLRLVEEALRESEDRFRGLSDASFEGIAIYEDGRIIDANQAFAALLNYDITEVAGAKLSKFVEPEFHELVKRNTKSLVEKPCEVVCIRKNGTKVRVEFSTKRAYYRGREAAVMAVRDITERRRMEDKLRTVFESISDGIALCGLDGRILEVNDAEKNLHGFDSKKEIIGQNFLELIAKQDRARARRNLVRRIENTRRHNAEYAFLRRDGSEFDAEVSVAVLNGETDKPLAFIAVTRDITERNRLKKNLQYYLTEIIKAQEEERRRIARELHDETVQSLAYLVRSIDTVLKDKGRLLKHTRQQLEQIREQTRQTMNEVRHCCHELRPDILDRLGLIPALDLIVDDVNKGGSIRARLEVNKYERRLPPETEIVMFRIVQEAMRNICRHSEATTALILVEVTNNEASITVEDNGRGFKLPEVLSDFAHKGKLGLTGMQERVRVLGGSFSVDSQMGKGTKITARVQLD